MKDSFSQQNEILGRIIEYNDLQELGLKYDGGFKNNTTGEGLPFYDFNKEINEHNWSNELANIHDEAVVKGHPIDFYERKLVLDYIKEFVTVTKDIKNIAICDFGCSTGYMLKDINNLNGDAILLGVDIIESDLAKLNKKNPEVMLFKFDITSIPFPDEILDVVVCLNVLEHIKEDEKVISEFNRVLKKNGTACVVVPFGDKLYDYYDKTCMHVRRYAKGELMKKLSKHSFVILRHNFICSLLYIPFAAKKKLNRLKSSDILANTENMEKDISFTKGNLLIKAFFKLDYILSKKYRLPFGIREIVLAKKEN